MNSSKTKGVAVITGASSGIGHSYAQRLAQRGYDLILVARRADRLQQYAQEIAAESGRKVAVIVADLTNPTDLSYLENILSQQEDIRLLVNNAGSGAIGGISKVSAYALDALVKLNVLALTRLSQAALAGFERRGSGEIINIASVIAFSTSATAATYAGSKAYVLTFTRSLQREFDGKPIRIQAVLPGPIRTEFFAASGVDDSIFPPDVFLSADELVDAALAGFDNGELVTIPSLPNILTWEEFDSARQNLADACFVGKVAARYTSDAPVGSDAL